MTPLDVRFAQKLQEKIIERLNALHRDLGSGSAVFIREDAAATGMNCARQIGAIQFGSEVLKMLEETEAELLGNKGE